MPAPAMNWPSGMSRVDRTAVPPAITLPSDPTTTPCGLIRYREPVAVSPPSICDAWPPVTRFSVAPEPLLIVTAPPAPMEKFFQSMTPRAPS